MAITAAQVIEAFLKTRNEIDAIKKDAEARVADLNKFQDARLEWLNQQMHAQGLQNMAVDGVGTCYYQTKESVTMGDWDAFFQYVQETSNWELLQHAVNKTAALEIMGTQRQNPPPPGVNYVTKREVHVRRK